MPGRTSLQLNNLGLNDNHCEVMAQELARDDALLRPIGELDLTGNPSIGQHGYEALLGLLSRRFNIGAVVVDDLKWKTTFDLVIFMNRKYRRGRFLENGVFPLKAMLVDSLAGLSTDHDLNGGAYNLNGVFPSKEMLVDFLAKLAGTRPMVSWDELQWLNSIWYTLRENPGLIYT
jgi:hypothetical protein